MRQKRSSKGIAHPGIIFTIVIAIVVVGFGGWYVWGKNRDDKKVGNTSQTNNAQDIQQENQQNQNQQAADPTTVWTSYSSAEGKFSLKYPPSWKLPKNYPDYCEGNIVLLGSDENTVGICQSDKMSHVAIESSEGDLRDQYDLRKYRDEYRDLTVSEVTVAGVKGARSSGIYAPREEDSLVPTGTKMVQYVFYTNGRTYRLSYNQPPSFPDNLMVFETIVTKTFKFSEK